MFFFLKISQKIHLGLGIHNKWVSYEMTLYIGCILVKRDKGMRDFDFDL